MSNMDLVKELDEYGKNKLATLMERLLIEIMGKESFEDLIFSFLINGDSKQEIIYKMKLRGLGFSEKAYDEIFEYIKTQMLEFKSKELQENYYFIYIVLRLRLAGLSPHNFIKIKNFGNYGLG